MKAVGVCGTDIHILDGRFPIAKPPLVLGHELAGEVVATGPDVSHARAGDRVTIDQVIGCGTCFFCRRGSPQFCAHGVELGITRDGGCQDFIVVPQENVYPIPDAVSFEEAAILDMEVWAALTKCGIRKGETVLVVGHGPAGLVASQIARTMGAARVILCGRSPARMEKARAIGVADAYVSAQDGTLEQTVRSETEGRGVEVAFEGAGTPESVGAALESVMPGGRVVLYGVQRAPLDGFDLNRIVLKDLEVYGALSDRRGWEDVISLVSSGNLRLAPLITHRFPLDQASAAYEMVRNKSDAVVKAVLIL